MRASRRRRCCRRVQGIAIRFQGAGDVVPRVEEGGDSVRRGRRVGEAGEAAEHAARAACDAGRHGGGGGRPVGCSAGSGDELACHAGGGAGQEGVKVAAGRGGGGGAVGRGPCRRFKKAHKPVKVGRPIPQHFGDGQVAPLAQQGARVGAEAGGQGSEGGRVAAVGDGGQAVRHQGGGGGAVVHVQGVRQFGHQVGVGGQAAGDVFHELGGGEDPVARRHAARARERAHQLPRRRSHARVGVIQAGHDDDAGHEVGAGGWGGGGGGREGCEGGDQCSARACRARRVCARGHILQQPQLTLGFGFAGEQGRQHGGAGQGGGGGREGRARQGAPVGGRVERGARDARRGHRIHARGGDGQPRQSRSHASRFDGRGRRGRGGGDDEGDGRVSGQGERCGRRVGSVWVGERTLHRQPLPPTPLAHVRRLRHSLLDGHCCGCRDLDCAWGRDGRRRGRARRKRGARARGRRRDTSITVGRQASQHGGSSGHCFGASPARATQGCRRGSRSCAHGGGAIVGRARGRRAGAARERRAAVASRVQQGRHHSDSQSCSLGARLHVGGGRGGRVKRRPGRREQRFERIARQRRERGAHAVARGGRRRGRAAARAGRGSGDTGRQGCVQTGQGEGEGGVGVVGVRGDARGGVRTRRARDRSPQRRHGGSSCRRQHAQGAQAIVQRQGGAGGGG